MVGPTSITDRKPFAAAFPIALLAFTFTTGSSHAGFPKGRGRAEYEGTVCTAD